MAIHAYADLPGDHQFVDFGVDIPAPPIIGFAFALELSGSGAYTFPLVAEVSLALDIVGGGDFDLPLAGVLALAGSGQYGFAVKPALDLALSSMGDFGMERRADVAVQGQGSYSFAVTASFSRAMPVSGDGFYGFAVVVDDSFYGLALVYRPDALALAGPNTTRGGFALLYGEDRVNGRY